MINQKVRASTIKGHIEKKEVIECTICLEAYDMDLKKPMMICRSQHNLCQECVKNFYDKHGDHF